MRLAAATIALRDDKLESPDQPADCKVVADVLMARGGADRAGQGDPVEQVEQFDHARLQPELRPCHLGKPVRHRVPKGVVIEPLAVTFDECQTRGCAGKVRPTVDR